MNRVAVCVAGQARAVEENFECIKRCILDPLQPDVFVHTWKAPEEEVAAYPQDPHKLIEMYSPKEWSISEPIDFPQHDFDVITQPTGDLLAWHFQRINSMYYSIYEANELKKGYEHDKAFTYDWVIRLRTDVILAGTLDLGLCDPNFMYLHLQELPDNLRCNDVFAFSSSENMDVYSSCYGDMSQIMRELGVMSATMILTHQLEGMEIKESPLTHEGFYREGNVHTEINKDLGQGKVPRAK
jgi:hypothetical protein